MSFTYISYFRTHQLLLNALAVMSHHTCNLSLMLDIKWLWRDQHTLRATVDGLCRAKCSAVSVWCVIVRMLVQLYKKFELSFIQACSKILHETSTLAIPSFGITDTSINFWEILKLKINPKHSFTQYLFKLFTYHLLQPVIYCKSHITI